MVASSEKANAVYIRDLLLKDLEDYYNWNMPDREFQKFNGPYYKKKTAEELAAYVKTLEDRLKAGEREVLGNQRIIADQETDAIIGAVNWYWKSEETLWMEVGIVIFNEDYWGRGIGHKALQLWIDEIFEAYPELVRIGMTTWSGNKRMMALAEKLGFHCEAIYRMARIVDGEYYDSVSYGILKEEWNGSHANT